jgi:hypothetical protein
MYLDAMSFLEEDLQAWQPFQELLTLTDEELERETQNSHGWTGRDLIAHLVAWQEVALAVAKDIAVRDSSPTKERADADWAARGDVINDEITAEWRQLPMSEVRSRMSSVAGELRGYLTVVPETRWLKNPTMLKFFLNEMTEHYEDHRTDLDAVLAAAGRPRV